MEYYFASRVNRVKFGVSNRRDADCSHTYRRLWGGADHVPVRRTKRGVPCYAKEIIRAVPTNVWLFLPKVEGD